jgi:DNA-binding helix-hairpin-helix protein with protein kinase domain
MTSKQKAMQTLEKDNLTGAVLKTITCKTVKVGEKLGEGGQGAVYRVTYNGKPKALKWYNAASLAHPAKFYENLENNIKKGSPNKSFLWPEDLTDFGDSARESSGAIHATGFGYIMNLRPPEYRDFSEFLLAKVKFASVNAMVNTALHIIASFRELHNSGYSYQDLNDGNFFVNPESGEALICDNDNVSEYGKNLGVIGKCRYMAPEIVTGNAEPSIHTDKFSLAVILFLLLMNNHPLEGKKAYPPCMTEEIEKKIYGSEPLFIFDPDNSSNAPLPGINNNAISRWPLFPKYVQDKFIQAFSQKALHDVSYRVIEKDWLKTFIRLRGDIYKCGKCGEVSFFQFHCPACGFEESPECFYIESPIDASSAARSALASPCKLAVHRRTRLYFCHTEDETAPNGNDFITLAGEVGKNKDTGVLELKNVSRKSWLVILPNGKQVSKASGKTVAIEDGTVIIFGSISARIKYSKL